MSNEETPGLCWKAGTRVAVVDHATTATGEVRWKLPSPCEEDGAPMYRIRFDGGAELEMCSTALVRLEPMPREDVAAAVLTDGFQIVVDHGDPQAGTRTYGRFATEEKAVEFATSNRSKLGLDRCVSWHVDYSDVGETEGGGDEG